MHPIKNEDHNYASVSAALEERLSAFNESAAGPLQKDAWRSLFMMITAGSRLLAAAEDAGRQAQCDVAYLSTFTFQAPAFYEKHGYAIFGELTGVPPGASRQWFRKDLPGISA